VRRYDVEVEFKSREGSISKAMPLGEMYVTTKRVEGTTYCLASEVDALESFCTGLEGVNDGLRGDAQTLRGYINTYGETPAMTWSNREYWKNRAERAETDVEKLKMDAEHLQYERDEAREANGRLVSAMEEARALIFAMDTWNEDVQKVIGRVPNTGFERAGDILAEIDAALAEARKEKV
jgi:FtsZ-binding cell division protein ZapB